MKKERFWSSGFRYWTGVVSGLVLAFGAGMYHEFNDPLIAKIIAYDVNKDGLMDLVGKEGNYYLQTKDGKFISYESVIEEGKAKIDSIYQKKRDSLKRIFENKLEKGVK